MSPYLKPTRRAAVTRAPRQPHQPPPVHPRARKRWPSIKEWRRWGPPVAAVVLAGIVVCIGFVAWVSQDLPDPNKINTRSVAQSTKIYARDGKTILYEIHGDQRRTLVDLKDIGQYSKSAILSIEDKTYYQHGAVSLRGIFRAIFVDIVQRKKAQGGSTLTQQLVKNSILTNEKSITRKVRELILSYQLERRFTKEQILKLYFNEIPWGSSAYGIEAAAQTYFGKHAKDLELPESALLAAMVQRPSYYSPSGNHKPELVARQKYVLGLMVEQGYITAAQAEAAKQVDVLARISPSRDRITAPHFVFYVRDLLIQKYGEVTVERGGLRVITTLDPELQKIAEEEVVAGAKKNERYKASNAALVAIDPHTGQIMAMVGSRDYFDQEHGGNFNVATAVRNPGSSFKPFVYLTAFTKGYTPDTILFDLKTDFGADGSGKNFSPNNYDFKEHGPLKMRATLAGSLNIPAVKTLYLAGIPTTLDLAEKFGYTTFDRSKVGLALAIGGGGVRLVEHVDAYATLANDGVYNPATPIKRVEDNKGKVLEEYKAADVKTVDPQNIRQLTSIMTDNNARAYVFGTRNNLTLPDRQVAAKTGTTNDFRDGWTMGFTPSLAAGVWVGNNDNSPTTTDGVVVAGPIWHSFMVRATKGKPVERFKAPAPNKSKKPVLLGKLEADQEIKVDKETGKLIPTSCLAQWPKNMIVKKTVKEVHDILFYVDKNNPNGPEPENPAADPMFTRWEKPVLAWAKKNNLLTKLPSKESCSLRAGEDASTFGVTITSPANNSIITDNSLTVSVAVSPDNTGTTVQYSIDGTTYTNPLSTPYSATINVSSLENGFHDIKVVATDAAGNTASDTITINVVGTSSQPSVSFTDITPKTKVAQAEFPKIIHAAVYATNGLTSAVLNLRASDGTLTVLDTIESPANGSISFSWPTTAAGSYDLIITVKDKKGQSAQSDALPVTVD